mmetsp:Transcript_87128/g.242575  ORF Transcript_87128/g.242575 Transcript_87128/m.242575 type:complete len:206 (+) Transcript_87128:464-1081(+)
MRRTSARLRSGGSKRRQTARNCSADMACRRFANTGEPFAVSQATRGEPQSEAQGLLGEPDRAAKVRPIVSAQAQRLPTGSSKPPAMPSKRGGSTAALAKRSAVMLAAAVPEIVEAIGTFRIGRPWLRIAPGPWAGLPGFGKFCPQTAWKRSYKAGWKRPNISMASAVSIHSAASAARGPSWGADSTTLPAMWATTLSSVSSGQSM